MLGVVIEVTVQDYIWTNKRKSSRKAGETRHVAMHTGFELGDFVLAAKQQPDKLDFRWLGPLRVLRVQSDWTYVNLYLPTTPQ